MTDFYDAAVWRNIPRGASACVYADGDYWVSPAQAYARFAQVRWITVWGGADAAKYAGCLDYETGNSAYEGSRLRDWAVARHDMNLLARPYFNRSDAEKAWAQVHDLPNVRPWIATLDGARWTAEDLAANLAADWHAPIPAHLLWGNQFQGGPHDAYDLSTLYLPW